MEPTQDSRAQWDAAKLKAAFAGREAIYIEGHRTGACYRHQSQAAADSDGEHDSDAQAACFTWLLGWR